MGRFINTRTGVVLNVDEETAATLGSEWESDVDEKPEPKRATRKGSAKAEK